MFRFYSCFDDEKGISMFQGQLWYKSKTRCVNKDLFYIFFEVFKEKFFNESSRIKWHIELNIPIVLNLVAEFYLKF